MTSELTIIIIKTKNDLYIIHVKKERRSCLLKIEVTYKADIIKNSRTSEHKKCRRLDCKYC